MKPGRGVATVLALSGGIGFFLGAAWHPTWHDAIEPAQVLAGVVQYPADNPVYLYSTRPWTAVHQLLAACIRFGASEWWLTLLLSGVLGMVSFQGLGLIVLAIADDVAIASLAPFFIFVTNAASGGVTYPIALMGTQSTYGVAGLSYMVLTLALVGLGRHRAAALLLGFAPAVHLTIGIWAWAVVGVTACIDRGLRQEARYHWTSFVIGLAAAMTLAAAHYLPGTPFPSAGASAALQHWDEHRQPFDLLSRPALALYFSVALAASWLWRFGRTMPPRAVTTLRLLLATAALGGVFSTSYWLVPPDVPSLVAWMMPSRILNVNGMTCMSVIIGFAALHRWHVPMQITLGALVVALLTLTIWMGPDDNGQFRSRAAWVAMAAVTVILTWLAHRSPGDAAATNSAWARLARHTVLTILVAALFMVVTLGLSRLKQRLPEYLPDHTTDPVLAAASRRSGLLLTAHQIHIVQAQTRRPILLDGFALDGLNYAPDAVPATDRILRAVYGTDLRTVQRSGAGALVDEEGNRALWEARRLDEWRDIQRQFGVTDVLTYAHWRLQLPVVASSADYVLYQISAEADDLDVRHERTRVPVAFLAIQ